MAGAMEERSSGKWMTQPAVAVRLIGPHRTVSHAQAKVRKLITSLCL